MWAERSKSVDNTPIKLGLLNFDIRGVQVTNNTPAYLFLGRVIELNRDIAMVVVEPYSDYQGPVHVPSGGDFYAAHGVTLGALPPNQASSIRYTNDLGVQLASRRYGRNIVIALYNGPNGVTSGISAQGIGTSGAGVVADAGANLPAFAARRTLYGQASTGTFTAAGTRLEYSLDNGATWWPLVNLLSADSANFVYNLDSMALPPMVRFVSQTSVAATVRLWAVVDL